MNRCPDCNKKLRRDPNSCPRCGWKKAKFNFSFFKKKQATGVCQNCGKAFYNNETECPRCGWKNKNKEDRISFGLCLISLLIPLFGITYWIAEAHERPRRARACGLTAILGPTILGILGFILLLGGLIMLA